MTDSLSLITAQITILDTPLAITRIPIEYLPLFMQPILRLLFGNDHEHIDHPEASWASRHDFLNISITPLEVSIICCKRVAESYFAPIEQAIALARGQDKSASISETVLEEYVVIQVDGQGLNAGQRVLEITGPLAMAGISIFFITTYFSDYIVLPSRAKRTVTMALEQRGFVFSKSADAFISQLSPSLHQDSIKRDYMSTGYHGWATANGHGLYSIPTTPPAQDIDELQIRTFKKLRTYQIHPVADESLRLVFCAGVQDASQENEAKLKTDLIQILLATIPGHSSGGSSGVAVNDLEEASEFSQDNIAAKFLSITITADEPVSILVEQRLLQFLGDSLVGAIDDADVLIPIIFDLRQFGFETTGIIGGVAGRLNAQGQLPGGHDSSPLSGHSELQAELDISFLSTAKSGTVMVRASQLENVLQELQKGYEELV